AGEADADDTGHELKSLRLQLEVLQEDAGRLVAAEVDERAVAEVVADWTGIPAGQVLADSATAAATLLDRLKARIVGQDAALDALCRRVRTYHAQLGEPQRPAGVFLLTGPSGVGKTETALALAELFFGGPQSLVTINLSEYQEAHTVSQLKGAPPGYVGHGKGGVLTEAVRRRPYAVLLLDEVEKAHRDVLELFYQVFDRGMLEDTDGQLVDFSNTLILMTSNVAAERIAAATGADDLAAAIRPELRRHFADAFLGRLVVVPFRALGEDELAAIARLKLARIQDRFATVHDVELTYDAAVVEALVRQAAFAETGARAIDARLTHELLPELAGVVLERLAARTPLAICHLTLDGGGAIAVEARP
ncbi:MAG: AAA family ATPase, partial [Alphaproteobacteria bacterium]